MVGRGRIAHSGDTPLRFAVVGDDARFRRLAVTLLRARGFDAVADGEDVASGLAAMERERPDAALIGLHLPDETGLALAETLVRRGLQVRVLLMSTDADALSSDLKEPMSRLSSPRIDWRPSACPSC